MLHNLEGVFITISECFISNSLVGERRSREQGLRKERSAVGAAASSAAAKRAPVAPATGNVNEVLTKSGGARSEFQTPTLNTP